MISPRKIRNLSVFAIAVAFAFSALFAHAEENEQTKATFERGDEVKKAVVSSKTKLSADDVLGKVRKVVKLNDKLLFIVLENSPIAFTATDETAFSTEDDSVLSFHSADVFLEGKYVAMEKKRSESGEFIVTKLTVVLAGNHPGLVEKVARSKKIFTFSVKDADAGWFDPKKSVK